MKLHKARLFFAGLALLLAPTILSITQALDIPALRGRVNDYAGIIRPDKAQQLEERLARFEQESGHQILILTIPSLEGDALEDFSIRVAEKWKIGQKGFDNGAILVVAQKDRKLRIEVGYGLEGVLPDAIAHRIISEIIVPRFRENDYSGGIEAGLNAIMQVTKGESLAKPARKAQSRRSDPSGVLVLLFMVILLALFVGVAQQSAPRAAASGAISSAIVGFLGAATVGIGVWILAVFLGSTASVLANFYARQAWGRTWNAKAHRRNDYSPRDVFHGGFGGGGLGGGGFGGGGLGGGGFSGGGGGFGGGGASGSW
jgi:uncharacterized protein